MKVAWDVAMKEIAKWVAAGTGVPSTKILWSMQGGQWPDAPWISLNLPNTRGVGLDGTRHIHNPLVVADDIVEEVDEILDTLLLTAHTLVTGDGPFQFTTTDTLPDGLELVTDYWVIVVDDDTILVATSRAAAVALDAIDLIDQGLGVHTLHDTADTRRVGAEISHIVEGQRRGVLTLQCFSDEAIGAARAQALLEQLRSRYKLPSMQDRMRAIGFAVATIGPSTVIGGSLSSASDFDPRATMEIILNYYDSATETGTNIETVEVTGEIANAAGTIVETFVFQSDVD